MAYDHTLVFFLSWLLIFKFASIHGDTSITTSKFLRDPETLESNTASFKFGFFSPFNSTNRYVGIWYDKDVADTLEVVWVANKENPLIDSSGFLKIFEDGNLQLLDGQNQSFWSTNVTTQNAVNTSVAQLLDTGNLVLNVSGNIIWQSFEHPTNSLLQHMELTFDENTTSMSLLESWKSASDPSNGRFTLGINRRWLLSEVFIWDDDKPYWRSGPWDGQVFMGVRPMYYFAKDYGFRLDNNNEGALSLSFSTTTQRVTEHYVITSDGMVLLKEWDDKNQDWLVEWQSIESECDIYGKCGEFGSCNSNSSPVCGCLRGFEPKSNQEWKAGNWSSGCSRKTPLKCVNGEGEEDGFVKLRNMKVPDNAHWLDSAGPADCRSQCLGNCSCSAYAYYLGFGCMIWGGTLIDIQEFSDVGVDLFIRLAHSELDNTSRWKVIIAVTVIVGITTLVVFLYFKWRWIVKRNKEAKWENDLPLFKFEDLVAATNNFAENNKLGRGGFGPVYKGKFKDGQEIAVKRLSRESEQGLQEFMNEVVVISKLQHRNLVRLLGCCVKGDEKLLVYEYMPNKSLDAFLFNNTDGEHLDWEKRFNIIKGISRGLLYLLRDSRLRIIHRDLKTSNILLDGNLNPKISDFGLARIFRGNQYQQDTRRIVGTYGYMSPEYAMVGRFSEKSDVFSFGVLLLEIVCGRRNSGFNNEESLSLLTHAWKLWNEDNTLSMIDPTISESTFHSDILRCIHVGLLCVQEFPEDRPNISMVVSMIENEVSDLPLPAQPGFTLKRISSCNESQQNGHQHSSVNRASISLLIGR